MNLKQENDGLPGLHVRKKRLSSLSVTPSFFESYTFFEEV